LRQGLTDLYGHYAENQQMLSSGVAASATHPALLVALRPWFEAIGALGQILVEGFGADTGPGSLLGAAIGHAISYLTWQSLITQQGATSSQAVELMVSMVCAVAGRSSSSSEMR
jgi:hypothetical protein